MKEVCIEIVLHKNTIQFFTTDRYDAGILSWVHSWILCLRLLFEAVSGGQQSDGAKIMQASKSRVLKIQRKVIRGQDKSQLFEP